MEFMGQANVEFDDPRAVLQLVLAMGGADAAKIECWHALPKSHDTISGVLTRRPTFVDVSAKCFSGVLGSKLHGLPAARAKKRLPHAVRKLLGQASRRPTAFGRKQAAAAAHGGLVAATS